MKPRLLVRPRTSPKRHPAILPGKANPWRYRTAPVPPAQRGPEPPRRVQARTRRPKGSAPRLLPLELHRPLARSSAARLLPGTSRCAPHARHPHRIPGDIGPSPANSVGMPALAGLRESGAARRVPGISAGKPSKEALHRRPIGGTQAKARSVARPRGGFAEDAGLASADRRKCAARLRPRLSKRPRKRP